MGYASQAGALAQAAVRDAFGTAVTYTPAGGAPVSTLSNGNQLTGRHHIEHVQEFDGAGMPVDTTQEVILFAAADLADVSISPSSRDVLATGGTTYTIRGAEKRTGNAVAVILGRAR